MTAISAPGTAAADKRPYPMLILNTYGKDGKFELLIRLFNAFRISKFHCVDFEISSHQDAKNVPSVYRRVLTLNSHS